MTVLDAYAVLAFLKDEPAAAEVRAVLQHGPADLTALGVAEVLDHLVRIAGADEEEAVLDVAQLGLLDGIPVGAEVGMSAGRLRARHYHRRRCAVSLADCVAAEVARMVRRPLATSDPALLQVCHLERIPITVLPDSSGARWSPAS